MHQLQKYRDTSLADYPFHVTLQRVFCPESMKLPQGQGNVSVTYLQIIRVPTSKEEHLSNSDHHNPPLWKANNTYLQLRESCDLRPPVARSAEIQAFDACTLDGLSGKSPLDFFVLENVVSMGDELDEQIGS